MTEACPTCRGDLTVGPVLSEPHPWCPTCGGIKGLRRVGTVVIGDDETAVYPAPGVRIEDEVAVYVLDDICGERGSSGRSCTLRPGHSGPHVSKNERWREEATPPPCDERGYCRRRYWLGGGDASCLDCGSPFPEMNPPEQGS